MISLRNHLGQPLGTLLHLPDVARYGLWRQPVELGYLVLILLEYDYSVTHIHDVIERQSSALELLP